MKIGIMQPYFVPYIGYWQLLNAVDKYVVYDDVNFIKSGWIHRNRILLNGGPVYYNVPMIGASSNKLIKEVNVNLEPHLVGKNMRIIEAAYGKAPFFELIFPIIEKIYQTDCASISEFNLNVIKLICEYLGIRTELILSSTLDKDNSLRGQDKVIAICELLNGTEYYNAIGGKELYDHNVFKEHGINLFFLKSKDIVYKQYENAFIPNLSIIDVMMFNSVEQIKKYLNEYTLSVE